MNDLPLHVDSSFDMYADDSTLDATGKTVEDLENKLNADVGKVDMWCESTHVKECLQIYAHNLPKRNKTRLHTYKSYLSKQRTRKFELSETAEYDC